MDSRQRKTRAKLAATVLSLASDRPANSITASEIAIAAGINRSTFYQHASSPTVLLEDVLRSELDAIRDEYLGGAGGDAGGAGGAGDAGGAGGAGDAGDAGGASGAAAGGADGTDSADAIEQVTLAVLRHVDEHAAIYRRGLGAGSASASLQPMLSEQFASTLSLLLARHALAIPAVPDAVVSPDFVSAAAARFIADGTAGAIEVWLRTPQPRDPEQFMAAYRLFLPAWWPHAHPSVT